MVEGRDTAEGAKTPEKIHHNPPHVGADDFRQPHADTHDLHSTPVKLIEAARTELDDQAVSGRFKRISQELLKDFVDFSHGAEHLLKSTFSSPTKDAPGDQNKKPSEVKAAASSKPGDDAGKVAADVPGKFIADVPAKFVKTENVAGIALPQSFNTFTPTPIGDGSKVNITTVKVKPQDAPTAESAVNPSEIPVTKVKTFAVAGTPSDAQTSTFQPLTPEESAKYANVTILKVHTVDSSTLLPGSNNVPGSKSENIAGPCDIKSAGPDAMKPMSITDFRAALESTSYAPAKASDQPPTNVPPPNPNDAAMRNIMFNPTPISQQKFEITPPTTTAPQDRGGSKESTPSQSILFNPTPIREQRVELSGGTVTQNQNTAPQRQIDRLCEVPAGQPLPPLATGGNLLEALKRNDNQPDTSQQQLSPYASKPDAASSHAMLNPTPIAEQNFDKKGGNGNAASLTNDNNLGRAGLTDSRVSNPGALEGLGKAPVSEGGVAKGGFENQGRGSNATTDGIGKTQGAAGEGSARSNSEGASGSRGGGESGGRGSESRSAGSESDRSSSQTRSRSADSPQPTPSTSNDVYAARANELKIQSNEAPTHHAQESPINVAMQGPKPEVNVDAAHKTNAEILQAQQRQTQADNTGAQKLQSYDQVARVVASVGSPATTNDTNNAVRNAEQLSFAGSLARATFQAGSVVSIESLSSKPNTEKAATEVSANAKAASDAVLRGDLLTGPISVSALSAKFATAQGGDLTIAQQNTVRAAAASDALIAANTSALAQGAAKAGNVDATVGSPLASGKGIFAIDPISNLKTGAFDANTISSRGLNQTLGPNGIISNGLTSPNIGNAQLGAGLVSNNALGAAGITGRPVGLGHHGDELGLGSSRIDPITGKVIFGNLVDGRGSDSKLSEFDLLEVRRTQRLVSAGGRYLTGVEIALAVALASAAVAKTRKETDESADADLAAEQLRLLFENADENNGSNDNKSANQTPNMFKRPVYLVNEHDSLVEIAERLYHDSDVAWFIADINAGRITEHSDDGKRIIELRSRQEIELPLHSEVQEYLLHRKKDATADRLVTIVAVSEIDRELLDSFLNTVVGGPIAEEKSEAAPAPIPTAALAPVGGKAHTGPSESSQANGDIQSAKPARNNEKLVGLVNPNEAWAGAAMAAQPLMALKQIGKTLMMPTMEAIMKQGLNLQTYISRIDNLAANTVRTLKPEPQR